MTLLSYDSNPAEFIHGRADKLILSGTPPSQAAANLRRLDELNLLTGPLLWELLAQSSVDPLFLIHILREYKSSIGFHNEEHLIGDSLVMLAGDHTENFYKVAYHIGIFTNDVTVMVRDSNTTYTQYIYQEARDIYEQIKNKPVGKARLESLVGIVRQQVKEALEWR